MKEFKVGDRVYNKYKGKGTVIRSNDLSVQVKFDSKVEFTFGADGRQNKADPHPSIRHVKKKPKFTRWAYDLIRKDDNKLTNVLITNGRYASKEDTSYETWNLSGLFTTSNFRRIYD